MSLLFFTYSRVITLCFSYEMMCQCWLADPEKRPSFRRLLLKLEEMLEHEGPAKHLFPIRTRCGIWRTSEKARRSSKTPLALYQEEEHLIAVSFFVKVARALASRIRVVHFAKVRGPGQDPVIKNCPRIDHVAKLCIFISNKPGTNPEVLQKKNKRPSRRLSVRGPFTQALISGRQ